MKFILISLLMFLSFSVSAKAPFGIEWGDDVDDYCRKDNYNVSNGIRECSHINNVKKMHRLGKDYSISGTNDYGVQKAAMSSDGYSETFGYNADDMANELISQLSKAGYRNDDNRMQSHKHEVQLYNYWYGIDSSGDRVVVKTWRLSRENADHLYFYIDTTFYSSKYKEMVEKTNKIQNETDTEAF